MSKPRADNRANNQVVFRGRNEKINKNIREYNETAKMLDQHPVDMANNESLFFYCECSDESCDERIQATFVEYEKHHKKRDTFIVMPDHVVPEIEDTIHKNQRYWVVKKHDYPLQDTTKLGITEIRFTKFKRP